MDEEQLRDVAEIRQMMRVGNQFDVILKKLAEYQYLLKFRIVSGSEFILCTQKRSDRQLKAKIFTTADAAIMEVQRLKVAPILGTKIRYIMVEI